jgi:alkylation response protein AidB-like acyl-CoA dehydrogenase
MDRFSRKHELVRHLETAMGSPVGDGLFSHARRVEEDESEQYPSDALHWLDRWGMQQHYVPFCRGGALRDFETLFALVRAISRRDLTVAVSHAVSFLGSVGVWIAGNQEQQAWLAERLLHGDRISLALTERNHGGDLLSMETEASSRREEKNAIFLTGEKWLINGATRNPLVSILARTGAGGGPRGFSLLLFDKRAATPGSFECLAKEPTLGVRGADVSGIRFHRAVLGASDVVGAAGEGFEIVLKGLQLSRLLCGAISLGAAETAFSATLDFALERRVYGRSVFEIPQCRRLLVEAWADLMLCESLLTAAARSLHFAPSEASIHSAVIKYLVPRVLEQTLHQLSVVLGARYYLRHGHHSGIFQKMLRDSLLVSLFDGSSIVNLYSLTTQFKALSRSWKEWNHSDDPLQLPICDQTAPLPEFSWTDLSLTSGGKNCFVASLPSSLEAAQSLAGSDALSGGIASGLRHQLTALRTSADALMTEVGFINFSSPHGLSSEAFDKAGHYCAVQGAAMALQMWLANRNQIHGPFADGQWLVLALGRLNAILGHKTNHHIDLLEDVAGQLLSTQAGSSDFSLECGPRPAPRQMDDSIHNPCWERTMPIPTHDHAPARN